MLGGRARVVEQVRTVVTSGKYQLGLKLTDLLADSGHDGARGLETELQELRSKCLHQLAEREVSAPGMNLYLTEDLVMRGLDIKPSMESKTARIMSGDIK